MPESKGRPLAPRDGGEVTVRPLSVRDLDPLLKFANALVKEKRVNRRLGVGAFDKRITRKSEKAFLLKVTSEARSGNGVNLAAFARERVVGFCNVERRGPRDVRHTGVLGIVIVEEYRGMGVGRRLMEGVLRLCSRAGVWLVELDVMAFNAPAIRLYEGVGFKRVGVVPGKILRDGELTDIIAMYADIRGTDKSRPGRRGRG